MDVTTRGQGHNDRPRYHPKLPMYVKCIAIYSFSPLSYVCAWLFVCMCCVCVACVLRVCCVCELCVVLRSAPAATLGRDAIGCQHGDTQGRRASQQHTKDAQPHKLGHGNSHQVTAQTTTTYTGQREASYSIDALKHPLRSARYWTQARKPNEPLRASLSTPVCPHLS